LRLEEGGKIYGYVYDRATNRTIEGVLIKAGSGEYENYGYSDETGYYEITVPQGEWIVEAYKTGYRPATGLKAVIASDYRLDIYLDRANISGYVWDAVETTSTGLRKPVVGAKIRIGDRETTTNDNGEFYIEAPEGEQIIEIEAPRYKTLRQRINILPWKTYEFYLWKVSAYAGDRKKVTLKLYEDLTFGGVG